MTPNQKNGLVVVALVVAVAAGYGFGQTRMASFLDSPSQQEALAVHAFKDGNPAEAYGIFRKLAEKGNTQAAYYLGEMYQFGDGVATNGQQAIKWLKTSADAGNVAAARQLGLLYLDGTVAVQDLAEARKWLDVAAFNGDGTALRNLGDMEARGLGGKANPVSAYAYYAAAATRGNDYAAVLRNRVARQLTPQQQADGQQMADKLVQDFPKPAKPSNGTSGSNGADKTAAARDS